MLFLHAKFNSPEVRTLAENDSMLGRTVLQLRELILKGQFGPGERISEHPLSARLGVSAPDFEALTAKQRIAACPSGRLGFNHQSLTRNFPTQNLCAFFFG